eukprot:3769596-Alexandrium_andersonii.AAC.1
MRDVLAGAEVPHCFGRLYGKVRPRLAADLAACKKLSFTSTATVRSAASGCCCRRGPTTLWP